MKKTFTYKTPNEIWIDDFSNNLTSSVTYDGPKKIYVLVSGESIISWSEENYEFYNKETCKVVELDAGLHPDIAYFLTVTPEPHEFEDETNPDGSIYQKIKNPSIRDYYELKYIDNSEDDNPWKLNLITRNRITPEELKVKAELEIAENYKQSSTFEPNITSLLDKYIIDVKDYLEQIKLYHPWKYVEFNPPKGPKISAELQEAFKNIITE
jgi:hypothetical protein